MTLRSGTIRMAIVALLAAGAAVGLMMLLFPPQGTTAAPTPGPLVRLAADFDAQGEESTDVESEVDGAAGGEVIWEREVFPPSDANTLYVTFSGTGDSHDGAATELACLVDGVPCPNDADSDGWTKVQKFEFECDEFYDDGIGAANGDGFIECSEGDGNGGPGDWHDNNINYTWCHSIDPGQLHHNVKVKLATDTDGERVYVEDMTYIVDAAYTPHGCTNLDVGDLAEPAGHGGGHQG